MINWIKFKIRVIRSYFKILVCIITNYDVDMRRAHARINELETLIRDRTNIAVDVGFKTANHVIVVGRYRNADYVQTYTLDTHDLAQLIDQLRQMERLGGVVRRIDAPPTIRAAFKRDFI